MKNRIFIKPLLLITSLMLLISSCSSDLSGTAEQLLESVPATAPVVTVCNAEKIIKSIGDVKNLNTLNDSTLQQELLANISESGIEPTVIVIFTHNNNAVFTGFLEDTDKFESLITDLTKNKFITTDGIKSCQNIVVKGNQFWFFTVPGTADVKTVKEWAALSKNQSYASADNIDKLIECKNPMTGRADIAALMNQAISSSNKSLQQIAMYQMALATIFDDAQFVEFEVELPDNELKLTADIINSKGKPAHVNLPISKINTSGFSTLGNSANMFGAINISTSLIEKINSIFSGMGGMPVALKNTLGVINGTCVIASTTGNSMSAVIPIDNTDSSALQDFLSQYGNVSRNGNNVIVSAKEPLSGNISAQEAAKDLKGCFAGIVTAPESMSSQLKNLRKCVIVLNPENESLSLGISLTGRDSKKSFLQQQL